MSAIPLMMYRHLGHPQVNGLDELGSLDLANDPEVAADIAVGFAPIQAFQRAMARRRARMQQQRCLPGAGQFRPPMLPPGGGPVEPDEVGYGLMGDELGGDDDLAGDELDISGLEADDEEQVGEDGNEAVGATTLVVDRKIQRLQAKIQSLEAKLASVPAWRPKRRQKIERLIARARAALARKEAKKDAKIKKLAAKMGISAAALAAAMASSNPDTAAKIAHADQALAKGQVNLAQGILGFRNTTPDEGTELPIPFTANAIPFAEWQLTAGAGPRTVTISMVTQAITYAGFRVKGVRPELQAQPGVGAAGLPPGDTLLNAQLDSCVVNGGFNLVYQPVSITSMFAMRGQPGFFWAVPNSHAGGLRDNPELQVNNTASLQVTVRNSVTIAAAINGTLAATLITERIQDAWATRF